MEDVGEGDAGPRQRVTIVIDGPNVATSYGELVTGVRGKPSLFGVQLAASWFEARGHNVMVFFPVYWGRPTTSKGPARFLTPEDHAVITASMAAGKAVLTPSGDSDDLYMLEWAMERGGFVVSNDRYRDHPVDWAGQLGPVQAAALEDFLSTNVITYTFSGPDEFLPHPTRTRAAALAEAPPTPDYVRVSRDATSRLAAFYQALREGGGNEGGGGGRALDMSDEGVEQQHSLQLPVSAPVPPPPPPSSSAPAYPSAVLKVVADYEPTGRFGAMYGKFAPHFGAHLRRHLGPVPGHITAALALVQDGAVSRAVSDAVPRPAGDLLPYLPPGLAREVAAAGSTTGPSPRPLSLDWTIQAVLSDYAADLAVKLKLRGLGGGARVGAGGGWGSLTLTTTDPPGAGGRSATTGEPTPAKDAVICLCPPDTDDSQLLWSRPRAAILWAAIEHLQREQAAVEL